VQLYNIELFNLSTLLVVITSSISKSKYFIRSKTLFVIFDTSKLQLSNKEIKQIDAFFKEDSNSNKRTYIKFILQLVSQ